MDEANNLEDSTHDSWQALKRSDGILVPGGFGDRGIEGKLLAAKYCGGKQSAVSWDLLGITGCYH